MKFVSGSGKRESEMLPLGPGRLRGLQELSDEVVHGIFSGGTGPSGGQRAGAGARAIRERTPAIHGDIGFRRSRCGGGTASGSRAAIRPRTALRIPPRTGPAAVDGSLRG